MSARDRVREVVQTVQQHGKFQDSPWERLTGLAADLFVSPTLPNIILGAAITATIQVLYGLVPLGFTVGAWIAWVLSLVVYAVGDEILRAYQAASQELDSEDWGIE